VKLCENGLSCSVESLKKLLDADPDVNFIDIFAPTIRLSHDDILARHQKHLIIIIIISFLSKDKCLSKHDP